MWNYIVDLVECQILKLFKKRYYGVDFRLRFAIGCGKIVALPIVAMLNLISVVIIVVNNFREIYRHGIRNTKFRWTER